jgi:ribosomal protein S18 acetylase RimI-like enzyme
MSSSRDDTPAPAAGTARQSGIAPIHEAALDHPVLSALSGPHARFAQGGALACRYPAEVAPFAAMPEATPEAFAALAALIPADGLVALVTRDTIVPPAHLALELATTVDQMIATALPDPAPSLPVVMLGAADAPDMLRLTSLTKPGPFGPRTFELGTYIGIREGGELIAMAGERMRLDGFGEISAVCVHPEHRGKGYAHGLVAILRQALAARGVVPFLHVLSDNRSAIALYERMGFTLRRRLHLSGIRHAGGAQR